MTPPRPLAPIDPRQTVPGAESYETLLTWPFNPAPFYEGQVVRLLQNDLRTRFVWGHCAIWIYHNPTGDAVGFGTLDLVNDYTRYTDGLDHLYIPLLAVHPAFQGQGYGKAIVDHLTKEAEKQLATNPRGLPNQLFLDVYVANTPAIKLYSGQQFVNLTPNHPESDLAENGEKYFIMARNLADTRTP